MFFSVGVVCIFLLASSAKLIPESIDKLFDISPHQTQSHTQDLISDQDLLINFDDDFSLEDDNLSLTTASAEVPRAEDDKQDSTTSQPKYKKKIFSVKLDNQQEH